jgi:thiamine pyrophosphokinase
LTPPHPAAEPPEAVAEPVEAVAEPVEAAPVALIIANGPLPGDRALRGLAGQASLVVATDGAARRAAERRVRPDIVLGDFDSLGPKRLRAVASASAIHLPDQDSCDLEKAIEETLNRGFRTIRIVGGLGRRWDHSLTTVSLLVRYADLADIRVVRARTEVQAVTRSATIEGRPGDRLSLVLFGVATGVTLTGVRWPLDSATMQPGSRGVSNLLVDAVAHLEVESGCVVVCLTRKRHDCVAGPP